MFQADSRVLKAPVCSNFEQWHFHLIAPTCFIISSSFWIISHASQMKSPTMLPKWSLMKWCWMKYVTRTNSPNERIYLYDACWHVYSVSCIVYCPFPAVLRIFPYLWYIWYLLIESDFGDEVTVPETNENTDEITLKQGKSLFFKPPFWRLYRSDISH